MKQYYLQDKRSYIGNSMLWWAKGGRGYTTKIDNAEIWTADQLIKRGYDGEHEKYRIWEKNYVDSLVERTVNSQFTNFEKSGL